MHTTFAQLHTPGDPLLLPTVWDAASAVAAAEAGARALATTSAGLAWALGRPDGDALTLDELVPTLRRITAAVDLPVSVDIEGGYAEVTETVLAVRAAGAVGINLEDGDRSPAETADRIAAVAGLGVFVHARTDVALRSLVPADRQLDEIVARAARYAEAGADGLFVPGLLDLPTLTELTARVDLPVGVMAGPGAPAVANLAAAGVARISLGSAAAQASFALVRRSTAALLAGDGTAGLTELADYAAINARFSR